MSYSPKFRVTKKTNQIKSLSFSVNSCESPWSLDFSLNRKHTLYKRRHQQKNNRRELLPSLGSPSTHRVGWLWTPNANVPLPHRWSSDISDDSQRDPVTTVGFPGGSVGKESTCNAGDPGSGGPLEKEMAICSSILAWRIIWTEETGGLHNCDRKRAPTPYLTAHIFFTPI